jgi:hypothetical protein
MGEMGGVDEKGETGKMRGGDEKGEMGRGGMRRVRWER